MLRFDCNVFSMLPLMAFFDALWIAYINSSRMEPVEYSFLLFMPNFFEFERLGGMEPYKIPVVFLSEAGKGNLGWSKRFAFLGFVEALTFENRWQVHTEIDFNLFFIRCSLTRYKTLKD